MTTSDRPSFKFRLLAVLSLTLTLTPITPAFAQTLNCEGDGVNTAIGCIPTDAPGFAGFLVTWGIGIGSGIAFLLILYSSLQIMTSSGDPKKLQAGQELLTAAISGLLFIIFSVFLLRIIGVEILGIFK